MHTDSDIRDLKQLAAFAKANPGAVTVGTTGIGSDDHLAMLMFGRAAGVQLRHIPFKGSADVRAAIAGKQITVAAINIGEALQYQKGGTPLRNLVQMSPARTNLAPDLPNAREQGYDIEMSSLRGMVGAQGPAAGNPRAPRQGDRALGRRSGFPGQGGAVLLAAALPGAGAVRGAGARRRRDVPRAVEGTALGG